MAKIAVLMSGGTDSAGAALRLTKQGHEVEGITARLWDETRSGSTPAVPAARETCNALGIRHAVVDLRDEFKRDVVGPFAAAYSDGMTPNPCAYCNRNLKLGTLARLALSRGFEFVATGHYARLVRTQGRFAFCEPLDKRKSQVYFLSLVNPAILRFLMFPLGDCRKDDVRRLVKSADLPVRAGDSQDLCFVGKGKYHDLLRREGCVPGHGEAVDVEGNVVGTHIGHTAYTLGQRFGIKGQRYYVIEKRPETNTIVIAKKDRALRSNITANGVNVFLPLPVGGSATLSVRYRYNSPPVRARLGAADNGRISVVTEEPCFAPAPGQVLAGYKGDNLIFGGIIESAT